MLKEKEPGAYSIFSADTREFDHKNRLPNGIYYYFISYDIENLVCKILFYDEDIKNLKRHKKPKNVKENEESKLEFKEYYTLPMFGSEVESLNFKGDDWEI